VVVLHEARIPYMVYIPPLFFSISFLDEEESNEEEEVLEEEEKASICIHSVLCKFVLGEELSEEEKARVYTHSVFVFFF